MYFNLAVFAWLIQGYLQKMPRSDGLKIIYKITYPNGKIYIGMDLVYNINYFGSANGSLIESDFTWEEQLHFNITKEILWHAHDATDGEVRKKELEFILKLESNNPRIGYNRFPVYKSRDVSASLQESK